MTEQLLILPGSTAGRSPGERTVVSGSLGRGSVSTGNGWGLSLPLGGAPPCLVFALERIQKCPWLPDECFLFFRVHPSLYWLRRGILRGRKPCFCCGELRLFTSGPMGRKPGNNHCLPSFLTGVRTQLKRHLTHIDGVLFSGWGLGSQSS